MGYKVEVTHVKTDRGFIFALCENIIAAGT